MACRCAGVRLGSWSFVVACLRAHVGALRGELFEEFFLIRLKLELADQVGVASLSFGEAFELPGIVAGGCARV